MKEKLIKKFSDKSATIGIIGLGYVGLPLAIRYAEVGYKVIGFDTDPDKAKKINAGTTYISHIKDEIIQRAISNGFKATTDYSRARETDALIMCVPTPLDSHREPDLSFVINTIESLLPFLSKGQVVSLESTTYPGTTDEELRPRIENTGLKVGEDIFLVYSPEREDPGNPDFSTRTIPKICSGTTPACLEVGRALYGQVIDQLVPMSSTRAAEMTKLLENIHRAVNIGLVNEMKIVADRMGINIHEVIDAAATKPFGFVPYYPGPGLGGHCIPVDPFYLTWKAREYEVSTRFIELAGEVNTAMPRYVIERTAEALNERKKPLNGAKILILGVAYKKNVDDMRESPALRVIELLEERGAQVSYHDPFIPTLPPMRHHEIEMSSVPLDAKTVSGFDAVLIVTDHTDVDYGGVVEAAQLVVDTRNATRTVTGGRDKIVKA